MDIAIDREGDIDPIFARYEPLRYVSIDRATCTILDHSLSRTLSLEEILEISFDSVFPIVTSIDESCDLSDDIFLWIVAHEIVLDLDIGYYRVFYEEFFIFDRGRLCSDALDHSIASTHVHLADDLEVLLLADLELGLYLAYISPEDSCELCREEYFISYFCRIYIEIVHHKEYTRILPASDHFDHSLIEITSDLYALDRAFHTILEVGTDFSFQIRHTDTRLFTEIFFYILSYGFETACIVRAELVEDDIAEKCEKLLFGSSL